MKSAVFRIIVVDDLEPWRNFVCLTLKEHSQSWLVTEASDGLEAVHKAMNSKSISSSSMLASQRCMESKLPGASGTNVLTRNTFPLNVARSKIIQEALRLGANGYIVRSDDIGYWRLSKRFKRIAFS
jgi:DNA-binding NarL/FixJ family response regulator